MKKFFWKRIIGLCFCIIYAAWAPKLYDAYEKRGISREIFRDTFYDLTFWCENCFLEYGEYGIDEYDWFFRHMKLTDLSGLEGLEFEIMDSRMGILRQEKEW